MIGNMNIGVPAKIRLDRKIAEGRIMNYIHRELMESGRTVVSLDDFEEN